jgi:chemotaxis receptor (MCP) glutamine deamidase CheD
LLAAHGFTIAMENIGGLGSRQVTFDLETGLVSVKRGAALAMPPTVTP